jgi:outer membrane protein OmpA-like peptidoglycan-associated protein
MHGNSLKTLSILTCLTAALFATPTPAIPLQGMEFPEKRPVRLGFTATPIAPRAQLEAEVYYHDGQARIELDFDDMKPAILFGGDVTCYVVWAVTRDGQTENLGELVTRKRYGKMTFSTGKKTFALLVTAESYYLVGRPSELVIFHNEANVMDGGRSAPFSYDDFVEAPRHSMDGIAHIIWDSKVPLELLQARKAYELAQRADAATHASQVFKEAGNAMRGANVTATSAPKSRELVDLSRRAVALSNEALNISMHRRESIELERQIAKRRAETKELERRAFKAEAAAEAARRMTDEARAEQERTRAETAALESEKTRLESAMAALSREKTELLGDSERLGLEKATLEEEARRLQDESTRLAAEAERQRQAREELNGRLQAALSHVAETQESVRGLVINLPDILFDLDEATLKTEAQLVLAKLTGILLILPDQAVTIEGHTDSTGSAGYNLDLSERRANAVRFFLQSQGLDAPRLNAVGYGMQRPVADNSTVEGRKRNRRVEIVISETAETLASR